MLADGDMLACSQLMSTPKGPSSCASDKDRHPASSPLQQEVSKSRSGAQILALSHSRVLGRGSTVAELHPGPRGSWWLP